MKGKKKQKRCKTPGCRNKRALHRSVCHKCASRKYRENNPMRASYQHLKDNAKRRGIYFDLTFEEFVQFCYETDYIAKVGKAKLCYSVDRVKEGPLPGYTASNIQVLTLSDNTKKELERRRIKKTLVYDYQTKWATVHKSIPSDQKESVF
jgi:hypothetical protein